MNSVTAMSSRPIFATGYGKKNCSLFKTMSLGLRYDHITPVLHQLQWLPVRKRVDFKMANLVYRSLSDMTSAFLAADCQQLSSEEGRRQLRSADSRTCVVRWTYSNFGDRCFTAVRVSLWNSLPAGLRQTDIGYDQFKRLLKTYLFERRDRGTL